MDDKFNQLKASDEWCVYHFGVSFNELQTMLPVPVIDKLYRMDVEIDELKTKIAALENKR